jgi:glycosyltransferase involved in cell wall biosynthesis
MALAMPRRSFVRMRRYGPICASSSNNITQPSSLYLSTARIFRLISSSSPRRSIRFLPRRCRTGRCVNDVAGQDIIVLTIDDPPLVNALQCAAAVVLQKSTREGFRLTVREAMFKGIGGDVGGIRHQIKDEWNGFLSANRIRHPVETTRRVPAVKLLPRSRLCSAYLGLGRLAPSTARYSAIHATTRIRLPPNLRVPNELL